MKQRNINEEETTLNANSMCPQTAILVTRVKVQRWGNLAE